MLPALHGVPEAACGMIDEVGREARFPLLLLRQIPCQLVNDRTDHLQMPKLLRADVRQEAL